MNRNIVVALIAAAGALALLLVARIPQQASGAVFIDASDRQLTARGAQLYATYCAACHGAALEGQPNWRERLPNGRLPAPPHDPSGHTWHHPDAQLFDIVKHGLVPGRTAPEGYESDMPAYAGILADEDIVAVLAYIKSTWPQEVREMQERMSREQARR